MCRAERSVAVDMLIGSMSLNSRHAAYQTPQRLLRSPACSELTAPLDVGVRAGAWQSEATRLKVTGSKGRLAAAFFFCVVAGRLSFRSNRTMPQQWCRPPKRRGGSRGALRLAADRRRKATGTYKV